MTKEELIQFLKDNLRIETNMGMIYQMTQQFTIAGSVIHNCIYDTML